MEGSSGLQRETLVKDWIKKNASSSVKFISRDDDQESVTLSFDGTKVEVVLPLAHQKDVMLFVLKPEWLSEKIMGSKKVSNTSVDNVLSVIRELVQAKKKPKLDESNFSDDEDESGSLAGSQMLSSDGGGSLAASQTGMVPEIEGAIVAEVKECNITLGVEDAVIYMRDLEVVRMRFSLEKFCGIDAKSLEELAGFLDISLDQVFLVDFSFAGSMSSLPLPSVSMLKEKKTKKDLSVCEWVRDIVRHVQDLYFRDRKELRHFGNPDDSGVAAATSMPDEVKSAVGDPNTNANNNNEGVFTKLGKKFITKKPASQAPPKELDMKTILELPAKHYSHGGVCWGSSGKQVKVVQTKKMEKLESLGCSYYDAVVAVPDNPSMSVEELLSFISSARFPKTKVPDSATASLASLLSMGFSKPDAAAMLIKTKFNVEEAAAHLSEQYEAETDETSKLIAIEQKNFYLCLLEFLGERLAHYQRYCISCHKAHNCRTVNAVVCPSALCVFRWEEFNLNNLIPSYQCVFEDCGSTNWAKKCLQYFGDTIENVSKKYGMSAQTVLELAFHKYLPRDEMMKFFQVIQQYKSPGVKSCLNPGLCARFERKLADMRELKPARTADELTPHVAYHGTTDTIVEKITENGFLLNKLASGTGDKGWYGAGIYCSPQASVCMGYMRGGKTLLVCAVVMGKMWKCPKIDTGCALKDGYDSHSDPSGTVEWVLFDEAAILPCFTMRIH